MSISYYNPASSMNFLNDIKLPNEKHQIGESAYSIKNSAVHGRISLRSLTTYFASDVHVTHGVRSLMTDGASMRLLHFLRKLRKLLQVALAPTVMIWTPPLHKLSNAPVKLASNQVKRSPK